jgi:hypothetical protein
MYLLRTAGSSFFPLGFLNAPDRAPFMPLSVFCISLGPSRLPY